MNVCIDDAVVADLRRMTFRVIEEVHFILMGHFVEIRVIHRHVRKKFSVVGIIGGFRVPRLLYDLLHTHAIVVILERYVRAFRAHLLQLAAGLPCVRPRPVVQRIANRVIGDRLAVVAGQLVLPVAVAVDVQRR